MPGLCLPGCLSVCCIHANENLIATCIIALGHNNISRSRGGNTSCLLFQLDYMCIIYLMLKCSTIMSLDKQKLLIFTLRETTVALVY